MNQAASTRGHGRESEAAPGRRIGRVWLTAFFFWSLPALLATHVWMSERDISFWRAFAVEGVAWYFWAFVTPAILWLTRRYPIDLEHRFRNVLAHLAAGVLAGALMGLATTAAGRLFGVATTDPATENTTAGQIAFWIMFGLLFYTATATVGFALDYHRKLREREVAASRLEAQLVEARLNALRMQLEPHFLFNALNTVSMLVRQGDDTTAVRVVARLSDLLRHVLDESKDAVVPLRSELDFVGRYLEIEQLRFRDRLDVRIDISEEVADTPVPSLLLQPLVENAIRHGIAQRAAATTVSIDARRAGNRVLIRLHDDGPGFPADWGENGRNGIGLRNTRDRLYYLYGSDASLTTANAPGGGADITLSLPLRPAHWTTHGE